MLEVPDNGVMIDYVSRREMNAIFDANWDGAAARVADDADDGLPSVAAILRRRANISRVDGFLKYADMHNATRDLGPVVYITLSLTCTAAFPGHSEQLYIQQVICINTPQ